MKDETKVLLAQIDAIGADIMFDYKKIQNVKEKLNKLLPGIRLLTVVTDKFNNNRTDSFFDGYEDNYVKSYFEYYAALNPWAKHHSSLPINTITHAQSRLPYADLVRTQFYHEWVKPMGDADDGLGLCLNSNEGASLVMLANFSIQRSEADRAKIGYVVGEVGKRLGRYLDFSHITRAQDAARSGLIRQSRKPTWLLSRDARIIDCNAEAEVVMRGRTLFSRSMLGRLEGIDALAKLQLSEAFKKVQSGVSAASLPVVRLRFPDDGQDCMLVFTEAPAELDLGAFSALVPSRILAVLVNNAMTSPTISKQRITSVFGLTPAEGEVVLAITTGETISAFAELKGISPLTARNQLRTAMEKIGVSRQAELVARIQQLS